MPGITTWVPGFPRASHIGLLEPVSCTEKNAVVIALLRTSTLFRRFPVGLLRLEGTMALHLPVNGSGNMFGSNTKTTTTNHGIETLVSKSTMWLWAGVDSTPCGRPANPVVMLRYISTISKGGEYRSMTCAEGRMRVLIQHRSGYRLQLKASPLQGGERSDIGA